MRRQIWERPILLHGFHIVGWSTRFSIVEDLSISLHRLAHEFGN